MKKRFVFLLLAVGLLLGCAFGASAAELPSQKEITETLREMQDQYPEGTPWSNENSYTWKGVPNETGYGCYAFAYLLSDSVFGELPARKVTDFTMDDVLAGDILVLGGYSVIALGVYEEHVLIAEGDYNGGIHWDGYLLKDEVESAKCLITRYPEGYEAVREPEEPVEITGSILGSGSCGIGMSPTVKWAVTDEGVLTVYGHGKMSGFTGSGAPWNEFREIITKLVVWEGVLSVGNDAFSSLQKLETAEMAQSVTQIDARAFRNCTGLRSVRFSSRLKSINIDAFENCSSLVSVYLPEGLTYLGSGSFGSCTALQSVYVPGTLENDFQRCFSNCYSLENVTLGQGMKNLGRHAFENCASLKTVVFPDTLEYIGNDAFSYSGLVEAVLPQSLKILETNAFLKCTDLVSVRIPGSLETFDDAVFFGCGKLSQVTLEAGLTVIPQETFMYCPALTEIRIPDTVKTLSYRCFAYSGLEKIILPEGLTTVEEEAFYRCDTMDYIVIPASVTQFHEYALNMRRAFNDTMDIYFYGTEEQWAGFGANLAPDNLEWQALRLTFVAPGQCLHLEKQEEAGKDPGCTGEGFLGPVICAQCGQELEPKKVLPALGHDWAGTACTRCGEVRKGLLGDADGDGEVTYLDAMLVLRVAVGLTTLEDETLAEVDGDGFITYLDAMQILRMAVGLV